MSSLLSEIEMFIAAHGLAETTFGQKALGDKRFIKELRNARGGKGRRPYPDTEERVRNFMLTYTSEREAQC